ncbi:MAG: hypothetical protein ACI934_001419 [Pseudohongiellaceae bacterium]
MYLEQDNAMAAMDPRAGLKREYTMTYIAEILSDDVIWLINENRRLISIHQNMDEATYYCQKHFQVAPKVIDRRVT